jgi:hypothetical protein
MTDKIRVGTMLIEDVTHTPESLVVSTERYSAGWSSIIGSTSGQLGKEIENNAGWTFGRQLGIWHRSSERRMPGRWMRELV